MPPISSTLDWIGKRLINVLLIAVGLQGLAVCLGAKAQALSGISVVTSIVSACLLIVVGSVFVIDRVTMFVSHLRLHRHMRANLAGLIASDSPALPFKVLCSIVRGSDGEAGLLCGECLAISRDREAVAERGCLACGRRIGLGDKSQ